MKYSTEEMLAIDARVRAGLGVGRGQTIHDVAARVARDSMPGLRKDAANILLETGEVWDRMARAAEALKPRLATELGSEPDGIVG